MASHGPQAQLGTPGLATKVSMSLLQSTAPSRVPAWTSTPCTPVSSPSSLSSSLLRGSSPSPVCGLFSAVHGLDVPAGLTPAAFLGSLPSRGCVCGASAPTLCALDPIPPSLGQSTLPKGPSASWGHGSCLVGTSRWHRARERAQQEARVSREQGHAARLWAGERRQHGLAALSDPAAAAADRADQSHGPFCRVQTGLRCASSAEGRPSPKGGCRLHPTLGFTAPLITRSNYVVLN